MSNGRPCLGELSAALPKSKQQAAWRAGQQIPFLGQESSGGLVLGVNVDGESFVGKRSSLVRKRFSDNPPVVRVSATLDDVHRLQPIRSVGIVGPDDVGLSLPLEQQRLTARVASAQRAFAITVADRFPGRQANLLMSTAGNVVHTMTQRVSCGAVVDVAHAADGRRS